MLKNSLAIQDWFSSILGENLAPLYNSVDIRYSGSKISVIDTNLFPGGFNNLNPLSKECAGSILKQQLSSYPFPIRSVLLIAEDHTRNLAYLENIRSLEKIFETANIQFKTAAFFEDNPFVCEKQGFLEIAVEEEVFKIYCIKHIIKQIENQQDSFDVIILNNDLSKGIPDDLEKFNIPVLPSKYAGWTQRKKSEHFTHYQNIVEDFVKSFNLEIDPWILYPLQEEISNCSITEEADREKLYQLAHKLFLSVQEKYNQHQITEKPYLILKNNQGTYGMGVHPIFDAEELLNLNRKNKNKLSVGKGGSKISHFLLQEGIPTKQTVNQFAVETVSYQIGMQQIGMFYRYNTQKSAKENLNSRGMQFTYDISNTPIDAFSLLCQLCAQFATLASVKEVESLSLTT